MDVKPKDQFALLPSGERVRVVILHSDGYATVRRIEGELAGTPAVCLTANLQMLERPKEPGSHPAADK